MNLVEKSQLGEHVERVSAEVDVNDAEERLVLHHRHHRVGEKPPSIAGMAAKRVVDWKSLGDCGYLGCGFRVQGSVFEKEVFVGFCDMLQRAYVCAAIETKSPCQCDRDTESAVES